MLNTGVSNQEGRYKRTPEREISSKEVIRKEMEFRFQKNLKFLVTKSQCYMNHDLINTQKKRRRCLQKITKESYALTLHQNELALLYKNLKYFPSLRSLFLSFPNFWDWRRTDEEVKIIRNLFRSLLSIESLCIELSTLNKKIIKALSKGCKYLSHLRSLKIILTR